MADPANNSLTDVKYKLILRARAECEISAFTVADGNPAGLTAADIAAWKVYRKAWNDIAKGNLDNIKIDVAAEMLVTGFDRPEMPDGWITMTRAMGDLPPILVQESELDLYDTSYDVTTAIQK